MLAAELRALLRLLVDMILDAVNVESVTTVIEPHMFTLLGISVTFVIIAVGLLVSGEPLLGNEGASASVADQLLFLLFLLHLLVEESLTLVA